MHIDCIDFIDLANSYNESERFNMFPDIILYYYEQ